MKKSLLIITLTLTLFSCNKTTTVKEMKTAYVDTSISFDSVYSSNNFEVST